jgi:hypothetical protein
MAPLASRASISGETGAELNNGQSSPRFRPRGTFFFFFPPAAAGGGGAATLPLHARNHAALQHLFLRAAEREERERREKREEEKRERGHAHKAQK